MKPKLPIGYELKRFISTEYGLMWAIFGNGWPVTGVCKTHNQATAQAIVAIETALKLGKPFPNWLVPATCNDGTCKQPFYPTRRDQIYCSHKCAVRISVRRHRERAA